jgi:hypothetical protein
MTLLWTPLLSLGHPLIAMVPYYLYANVEKFPVQVMPKYHYCAPAPNGGRAGARGVTIMMKRGIHQSKKISEPAVQNRSK